MKLSTTKFALLLALVVCFVTTKVLAHHHEWREDHDCEDDDEDEDDDDKDWDNEDWDNGDWDDDRWDNDNNDNWSNGDNWNNGENWNGDKNWNSNSNGQGWNTEYKPSGSIVAGGSTIWSGSGWPAPTNSYGQPAFPTQPTPGVVTATWTQVLPTGQPTNVKGQPQYGNMAR